ncbi:Protein of unknown function DUF2506 [Desulfonatronospira thiodismutans ASO3-1]|uniref:DUF2628 domain-containing protein n=2 Tax=Desulfonatronospira TaxID=488937 RepID=D6STU4_9BACT|nr:DUF2628 domain-containing protein [Desulfonatronospira thiodismutans]EFI34110.1 Protein of unknown function DUF2506 [Desulfonatronospira thiodismutans ASO3-1]
MRTFKIFKHPTQGYEAVKVGFSWPAFFFDMIWMLVKKLWIVAGIWFCLYIAFAIIDSVTQGPFGLFVLIVIWLSMWLIPGFKGNEWRESNLSGRGYEHIDTVQAGNPDSAIAQVTKKQEQSSEKGQQAKNAASKAEPKPEPFAGFQDIPDPSRNDQKPKLQLPKGRG